MGLNGAAIRTVLHTGRCVRVRGGGDLQRNISAQATATYFAIFSAFCELLVPPAVCSIQVRTVRAFGAEGAECARYERRLQKQATEASLLGLGIGLFQGSSNICINAAILLVLHQGGTAVLAGELTSGNLTTFLVSTQQIQRALAQLSVLFGSAVKANAAGCVGRVFS